MLHLHRAEQADALVLALGDVLAAPQADPFTADVIAVPAKGVERWITQRLSHTLGTDDGDGVCANVLFRHPNRIVSEAVWAAVGMPADEDPWARERLTWTLLDIIDRSLGEPWCSTLSGHLAGEHRRGRRLATAAHLARLFDSYGDNRPQMVRDWADGRDTDGTGSRVDDDLRWQPELWRQLRQEVDSPSPAERLPDACRQISDAPELVDLPERLSVFGPTRLSTAQLEVLAALAHARDVHLWLPHPSAALWQRVAVDAEASKRSTDPTATLPRHPLIASLARDAREMQVQLAACDVEVVDRHHAGDSHPDTLLGRLQLALHWDDPAQPTPLDPSDRSVQVHACHGRARQVEVLREVLVGLLADDESLEPRDVLVMCPDIETYAPLISATFGLADEGDGHPGHRLRVRLADRSLRQTNPLLGVVAGVLDLAAARVTASEVLDLAASPPVRRRFGFSDDDLDRLHAWVSSAGIRWGLDAEHRRPFELQDVRQNTWESGLDRLLLGIAMTEDDHRWVGDALPVDDVDSNDVDLVGRFTELLDRLRSVLDATSGSRPLDVWLATLTRALDLLTSTSDEDEWQQAQARRELARVAVEAGERAATLELQLGDVRMLLGEQLAGRPTRANFRTGNLTMCSMVPMRSVPHRVICLLGLDDGAFPRTSAADGDDVLARDPCVGERDPRSEDRQLLLDAVLAAREHLVLLYTGADPRTNVQRAPAVPVGEILDAVDAMCETNGGRPAREQIVVRHPLQPFDARNFTAEALGTLRPFSFDRHALRGAQRALLPREEPDPFLVRPLPSAGAGDVALDDLIRFVEHPTRAFLRQRLALTLLREEQELDDAICVELDNLEQWEIGDRLLRLRLDGVPAEAARGAERRRGTVPPEELGKRLLDDLLPKVEAVAAAALPFVAGEARTVDVDAVLAGRHVTGTIGGVRGNTVVRATYSTLSAKHRLRAWVQLLACTVTHPQTQWQAVVIGKKGLRSVLGPLAAPTAEAALRDLLDLYDRGMREPLPLVPKTSAVYATARAGVMTADNAYRKAEQEWKGNRYPGERNDDAHELVWGEAAEFAVLLDQPPDSDERWFGGEELTRFGALSRRLWAPLLAVETS